MLFLLAFILYIFSYDTYVNLCTITMRIYTLKKVGLKSQHIFDIIHQKKLRQANIFLILYIILIKVETSQHIFDIIHNTQKS
jgi:hypothetical protein